MADNYIMVINDSTAVLKFVSFTLRSNGYKVVTACDGKDGLEKLSAMPGTADLIIADLNISDIDGNEFIARLKTNERYGNIPVIILTPEKDCNIRGHGEDSGISSYLEKPFKADELLTEVSKCLAAKQTI